MIEKYKYYPQGDRKPSTRNQRIGLEFDTETREWRFTAQLRPLDRTYLEEVHMNIADGRGKIVRLKDDGWTSTRTNIQEVLKHLPSRKTNYDY